MEAELKSVKDDVEDWQEGGRYPLLTEAQGAQKVVKFFIWLSGTTAFVWLVTYYKAIMAFFKG